MEKENNSTVKAVSFMMIITLVGKILGLIRDQLLAGNYSVGMEASAFLTASRIPRIFFDVVFASAISASFIPVFNEYMKKRKARGFPSFKQFYNGCAYAYICYNCFWNDFCATAYRAFCRRL